MTASREREMSARKDIYKLIRKNSGRPSQLILGPSWPLIVGTQLWLCCAPLGIDQIQEVISPVVRVVVECGLCMQHTTGPSVISSKVTEYFPLDMNRQIRNPTNPVRGRMHNASLIRADSNLTVSPKKKYSVTLDN